MKFILKTFISKNQPNHLRHIIFFCFSTEIFDKGNLIVNTKNQSAEPISSSEFRQKMLHSQDFVPNHLPPLVFVIHYFAHFNLHLILAIETNITASKFNWNIEHSLT